MKRAVIIVAAGKGTRMQSSVPKQFMLLDNIPVLCRTVKKFLEFDPEIKIYLVLTPTYIPAWLQISAPYLKPESFKMIEGGNERFYSVKNAVNKLPSDIDFVAVHDGVRPLVSVKCIANCFAQAALKGSAVPCIDSPDTVRYSDSQVNKTLERSKVKMVQTPQVFSLEDLKKAYQLPFSPLFTDDACVVEKSGCEINLVEGEKTNIKITDIEDFKYAEYLIKQNKL